MIVNYKAKQCFIHLPKSGGTSVMQRLLDKKNWHSLFDAHDKTRDFRELDGFEFTAIIREPDDWYKSMYTYSELTGLPEKYIFSKIGGVVYLWQRASRVWRSDFSIWQENAENMKWKFHSLLHNYISTFRTLGDSSNEYGWYTNRLKYQLDGLTNLHLFKYENIDMVFEKYKIAQLVTNVTTLHVDFKNCKSDLSRDEYAVYLHKNAI